MDVTEAIAPRSDQMNAEDLLTGPRTFTIAEVTKGSAEQPVCIHLAEFPKGRPFKPSKTVLRIFVAAWGKEAQEWVGRRVTLYRDPDVKWAGAAVGGIRVSAMSHIEKPLSLSLTETRGTRRAHKIQPLKDEPAPTRTEPTAEQVAACTDVKQLGVWWKVSSPDRRAQIEVRVTELRAEGGA